MTTNEPKVQCPKSKVQGAKPPAGGLLSWPQWRPAYFKLEGKRVVMVSSVLSWAQWFESADRRVAETMVGRVRVSTVFLGINHRFGPGEPLLFETMVFGGALNEQMSRSATWVQAENDHAEIVRLVTSAAKRKVA